MMIEKTLDYILTELKLSGKNKINLLVEGEFDLSFWRNKLSSDINIICCGGKNNIIEIFNKKIPYTYFAILDQDYATLCNKWPIIDENIIYTDFNDLETTLFSLGLAQEILNSYCDIVKMKQDNIYYDDNKSIFRDAINIGKLRYISINEGLNVPFEKKLAMGKYYNKGYFNKDELYYDFCKCTQISYKCLIKKIEEIPHCNLWLIVRGHDCIININNILSKYKISKYPKKFNAQDAILLLIGEKYKNTTMFQEICNWGNRNNINIIRH